MCAQEIKFEFTVSFIIQTVLEFMIMKTIQSPLYFLMLLILVTLLSNRATENTILNCEESTRPTHSNPPKDKAPMPTQDHVETSLRLFLTLMNNRREILQLSRAFQQLAKG